MELKGPDTACLSCQVVSYYGRPEDEKRVKKLSFTEFSLYYIDLVKDEVDRLWKIKKRNVDIGEDYGGSFDCAEVSLDAGFCIVEEMVRKSY